jgi:predicted transcriptional regulator
MRQLLVAYLETLRFRVRTTQRLRELTGEPITLLDTIVNLEVYLFAEIGGTLQQEILNSLDAPRTSVRDSLARLVRSGLVERRGRRYVPADNANLTEIGPEFIRLSSRLCDAISTYRDRYGRIPPM